MKSKELDEPSCELNDLINNNNGLILLTGNYRDFFGKLFYSNKLKIFEEKSIKLLKKHFSNRIYFEIQRHLKLKKNFENFIFKQL